MHERTGDSDEMHKIPKLGVEGSNPFRRSLSGAASKRRGKKAGATSLPLRAEECDLCLSLRALGRPDCTEHLVARVPVLERELEAARAELARLRSILEPAGAEAQP